MQLSNHLFEELAMDVYDEVDRRETDAGRVTVFPRVASSTPPLALRLRSHCTALVLLSSSVVWLATQNHSTLVTETTVVPFLPVNPEYSSTRNQASELHRAALRTRACFSLRAFSLKLDCVVLV